MQECMQKLGIKDSLPGLLAMPLFFFSAPLSAFVWHSLVLLASFSFLLPVLFSSLSLLLCSAFLFLKAGAETNEDDRCWSFSCHAGFGLCLFSLLLLMLSLEMTKMMEMKACCAGGVIALAFVFSLLSTMLFLWLSLPCLSLVSSCLSFLVFLCFLLSFLPSFSFFFLFTVMNKNSLCSLCFYSLPLLLFSLLSLAVFSCSFLSIFSFFCAPFLLPSFFFLLGQQRQSIYSLYTALIRKDSMH